MAAASLTRETGAGNAAGNQVGYPSKLCSISEHSGGPEISRRCTQAARIDAFRRISKAKDSLKS